MQAFWRMVTSPPAWELPDVRKREKPEWNAVGVIQGKPERRKQSSDRLPPGCRTDRRGAPDQRALSIRTLVKL